VEIDILEKVSAPDVEVEGLRHTLESVLRTAGEIDSELAVSLVDDEEIRRLSCRFLNRDLPTDVLSFPQRDDNHPRDRHLGDIVISVDTARRQAAPFGHSVDAEVRHLAEHGLLHRFGYEHDARGCSEWNKAAVRLGLPHHILDIEGMQ
jgi:probable rRNA maturation factor